MGRQRKNTQSKGKEESLEKELNETEASNLSGIEFKIMVKGCTRSSVRTTRKLVGTTSA